MVEEGASEKFDEISIEGRDSINRENFLKYIRSKFVVLSLKNIESLKENNPSIKEESKMKMKKKYIIKKTKKIEKK